MNPSHRQADRPDPPRPAGAGQGAQLPLPRRRASRPRGGDPRRRPRRGDPHHSRGLAVPGRVRRADRPGQPGLRAGGLHAHAVQAGVAARGAGRDRRAGRGLLHGGHAPLGRGALPRRGEEAPRRDRGAARPLRLAPPPAARAGGRRRAGPGRPGVVGGARLPAADRPGAARAPGPQDDQPPVLERRRGGGTPPALDRPRARARRRGGRRRQPAAAADRPGGGPGDDGRRLPHRGAAPAGGRGPQLHPELDQGGQVHVPQERARAHGHAARGAGGRAPALPPRRGRGRRTSRPPPRWACARRSCGASSPTSSSS